MACMRRSVGGKSFVSPIRSAQSSSPSFCEQPRRRQRHRTRLGIGKQMVQNQALEPARAFVSGCRALHGNLERLDHLAVLHA